LSGQNERGLEPLLKIVDHMGIVPHWKQANTAAFEALFGGDARYDQAAAKIVKLRAPDMVADETGVPYAAFIHPTNQDSGAYGGMSFVIFPMEGHHCLVALVLGTAGLPPDEGIIGRPGHARKAQAICAWLNKKYGHGKLVAWAKQDPARIDQAVPPSVVKQFSEYQSVFKKYGKEIYALFAPTDDVAASRDAVTAFVDLLFDERLARVVSRAEASYDGIQRQWRSHLTPEVTESDVIRLLKSRRYVVIEGPPGTGKTRMAERLVHDCYADNGKSVQFHPNTTYENFVGGLAPTQTQQGLGLSFTPNPGYLMEAAARASASPDRDFLLHIDEINRADLSKILGEAIYLFEPGEQREIDLPYDFGEPHGKRLSLPTNLHVLGTMNTADRSLAIVDVAVRRRFAFTKLWPQRAVVAAQGDATMTQAFDDLMLIFVEYATADAFDLVPGHSYFLLSPGLTAAEQLKVTLKPLLEEYLAQGYVGGFSEPIRSYLQWIESL
jgi:5-methylcytosine-specific restriction enzyme B